MLSDMSAVSLLNSPAAAPVLPEFLRAYLRQVVIFCNDFRDWQRREILLGQPTPEKLAEHRTSLKWLLRILRLLHAQAKDPDFPDREFVQEIEGRLVQLEESWALFCAAKMSDAEADALLKTAFPE